MVQYFLGRSRSETDLGCRCGPGVRAGLGRVHLRPSPHSFSCSGLASGRNERTRDGTPSAAQMSELSRGLAPFLVPRKPGLFGSFISTGLGSGGYLLTLLLSPYHRLPETSPKEETQRWLI